MNHCLRCQSAQVTMILCRPNHRYSRCRQKTGTHIHLDCRQCGRTWIREVNDDVQEQKQTETKAFTTKVRAPGATQGESQQENQAQNQGA